VSTLPASAIAQDTSPAGAADPAIVTTGLTKRFRGGQLAVDDLGMVVPRGSVYGFLGPNGSGKTTTIRMLLGLVYPTRGSHTLLGVPMPAGTVRVLPRVGSLVEGPAFYPQLSGWDNLARVDAADRTADPRTVKARIGTALDRVGLLAAKKKHYRAYSLGMKQRLAIAASLLRPRELVILDEPTNGLDPHVGVMRTGRLVFQGTLDELRTRGAARIQVRTTEAERAAEVLGKLGLADIQAADGAVTAALGDRAPQDICRELVYADIPVAGLDTPRPSLEDLFVGLTGEGFDVDG
jgi:ABC-2 type transport system ATP-binding protein